MAKNQQIVCIKASKVEHRENGFVDYMMNPSDIMTGHRDSLESDPDFRQVLPVSIFMHQGKVWAYERTSKGGESRLHNKVAVAVGGHWDLDDLVHKDSIIDLEASFKKASEREIREEVKLTSTVLSSRELEKKVCADDTEVDKLHIAVITVHELDGEGLDSAEDELKTIGFKDPKELLEGDYNLETWARIICEILAK